MSEKNRPTAAGITELTEEDLDQVQGGGGFNAPLKHFKVEIEGVTQGAFEDPRDKKP